MRPSLPAIMPARALSSPARTVASTRTASMRDSVFRPARCDFFGRYEPAVSPACQCVNVLYAGRQRRFAPRLAAVVRAEHFAVARRDIDLLGVTRVQRDRHQRAVRLHLVETLPSFADVAAAIKRAVLG